MRRRCLLPGLLLAALGSGAAPRASRRSWWADPRAAVLVVLGGIAGFGLLRNARRALGARRAIDRLEDPGVSPGEVEAAAGAGRAALPELIRLAETGASPDVRAAAARGVLALWRADELVAEEEKAAAARLFRVEWDARRRYPRALAGPIPFAVRFGLEGEDDPKRGPGGLAWSHRVAGSQRAALEAFGPWSPGPGRAEFAIEPGDFPGAGPHRVVLQARLRTPAWELDLPHAPFRFEFDPRMAVESLFAAPDEERGRRIAGAVRLAPRPEGAAVLPLNGEFALRDPPELAIVTPLPCDLAHRVRLEFEGLDATCPAGAIVLSGQAGSEASAPGLVSVPLALAGGLEPGVLDRPRSLRVRAVLEPDAELGWGDPRIRSLWPGPVVTDWREASVIRA